MTIFFWKASEVPDGAFCQWYPAPFSVGKVRFPTAEHYMMYQKAMFFNDNETAAKILTTKSPRAVKTLGRAVKNFSEAEWDKKRYSVVLEDTE